MDRDLWRRFISGVFLPGCIIVAWIRVVYNNEYMHDAIKNFSKQFEYEPIIENAGKLSAGGGSSSGGKKFNRFIVAGMGGSNLVVDLFRINNPELDIISHRGYGLPNLDKKVLKQSLIIASSYSGNTEETLDAFKLALKRNLPVAVISTSGKLLELARKAKISHIQLPNTGIQPRLALGYNALAVAKLIGDKILFRELGALSKSLKSYESERIGKALAKKLKGHVPVICSSLKNLPIAYNWKIKINETGKIPAFINYFPELNHNEMTGYDIKNSTKELSKNFYFVFLKDVSDNPRIVKRMNVTERLYHERGFPVEVVMINGSSAIYKAFSSLLLADWTSYYIAKEYGVDPEQVPMVEEFKKLIK